MRLSATLLVALALAWLAWSGHFADPLLLSLGLLSSLFTVGLVARMGILDSEAVPIHLGLKPFTHYAPWLLKEIIESNIDVTKRILNPRLPIHPRLIVIRSGQTSALAEVILANSITLTPGTVSVDVQHEQIWVHALSADDAQEDMSGEMRRRVSELTT